MSGSAPVQAAMISVDQARDRILAGLKPTPAEVVALANAWNRVTAEPVRARLTQLAAAHAKLPHPAEQGRSVGQRQGA